jgi:hypothetical protein
MPNLTSLIGHTEPLPPSLTDPENHGMRDYAQPIAKDGETILLQEPGRVIGEFRGKPPSFGSGTCLRAFCFALIDRGHRSYVLRVRHGGGVEDVNLQSEFPLILMPLDSDARFLLMFQIHKAESKARRESAEVTASRYQSAFLQGRLKKQRVRGAKGQYRAEIEPLQHQHITASVALYGNAGDRTNVRRESFGYIDGRVRCLDISETPAADFTSISHATLDLLFDDGRSSTKWVLGTTRLDPAIWAEAKSLGLKEALMATFINEVNGYGHTGEAFRNPILALEALKAKVAA